MTTVVRHTNAAMTSPIASTGSGAPTEVAPYVPMYSVTDTVTKLHLRWLRSYLHRFR